MRGSFSCVLALLVAGGAVCAESIEQPTRPPDFHVEQAQLGHSAGLKFSLKRDASRRDRAVRSAANILGNDRRHVYPKVRSTHRCGAANDSELVREYVASSSALGNDTATGAMDRLCGTAGDFIEVEDSRGNCQIVNFAQWEVVS